MSGRHTAQHEAGHVAAMVVVGRLPVYVSADRPTDDSYGLMKMDWGDGIDVLGALDLAVAILCGPLVEPELAYVWPPEWPLDPDEPGDEGHLAACIRYLKLDEGHYYGLVRKARRLIRRSDFNRIMHLVTRGLELADELDADDLRRLLGPEILRDHEVPLEVPRAA